MNKVCPKCGSKMNRAYMGDPIPENATGYGCTNMKSCGYFWADEKHDVESGYTFSVHDVKKLRWCK